MANWTGAIMFAAGLWLLWAAWGRRRRLVERLRSGAEGPRLHPSLGLMAELGPPIVIIGLVIAGGQVVLAFFMTEGGNGTFSMFDLAGFVFLLATYGVWLVYKTKRSLRPDPDADEFGR